ncbi:MAG TPA: hypothetical protein VFL93_01675 [Longimicrobiaceae bacterium]|jgi:hypothetical protein|nr:hypothetical protein [Longimicrobiaceae bacterium]
MSSAADRSERAPLPRSWERLEHRVEEAAVAVATWRRRALEAEEEIVRMRRTLEAFAGRGDRPEDTAEELRRLRAENAVLRSRMVQARKRVTGVLRRLGALGIEP